MLVAGYDVGVGSTDLRVAVWADSSTSVVVVYLMATHCSAKARSVIKPLDGVAVTLGVDILSFIGGRSVVALRTSYPITPLEDVLLPVGPVSFTAWLVASTRIDDVILRVVCTIVAGDGSLVPRVGSGAAIAPGSAD